MAKDNKEMMMMMKKNQQYAKSAKHVVVNGSNRVQPLLSMQKERFRSYQRITTRRMKFTPRFGMQVISTTRMQSMEILVEATG